MPHPSVTWTKALSDAARVLGTMTCPMGGTIPERARELADYMRPGAVMTGMQLDCVAMLRSRIHSYTDNPKEAAEAAFNAAWAIAWSNRQTAPEDRYDHALDV